MPVEVALPAGVGDEVIVDTKVNGTCWTCGLPSARMSFLIDDLCVE
jgi:hypothetical protein